MHTHKTQGHCVTQQEGSQSEKELLKLAPQCCCEGPSKAWSPGIKNPNLTQVWGETQSLGREAFSKLCCLEGLLHRLHDLGCQDHCWEELGYAEAGGA